MLADVPVVATHGSYGGLKELRVTRPKETLLIISASTSGALVDELIALGADEDRVATIYHLSSSPTKGHVLCGLAGGSGNSGGFAPINSYAEAACRLCREGSVPVKIQGDQFLLEPPRVDEVEIRRDDLPPESRRLLERFSGKGLFRVFRDAPSRRYEIYVDVERVFGTDPEWETFVRRGLTVHLRRIVYSSYPYSEQLAQRALQTLPEGDRNKVSVIDAAQLGTASREPETATLVVAACIADHQELLAINRDLRRLQPRGDTTYACAVFRSSSVEERRAVRTNITYGERGPNAFTLVTLADLELPQCSGQHSWVRERHLLEGTVQWAEEQDVEVPSEIKKRIKLLQLAPSTGLEDGLFWDGLDGTALKIRPDFALLDTAGGRVMLTQADVYVCVASYLHQHRRGILGGPKLSHLAYERSVLSPSNFQRFTDGVIQAALLRAVRDGELAYRNCDGAIGDRLCDQLLYQIARPRGSEGEAMMEFLLAVATERLLLWPKQEKALWDAVLNSQLPPHAHFLARFAVERVNT
jgi:hypothetical protein